MYILSEGLGTATILQKLNKATNEQNQHNVASIIAIHNLLEEIITNQGFRS